MKNEILTFFTLQSLQPSRERGKQKNSDSQLLGRPSEFDWLFVSFRRAAVLAILAHTGWKFEVTYPANPSVPRLLQCVCFIIYLDPPEAIIFAVGC